MENSKQELLVQSLATSSGATVARDLGLFNGELVVVCKLLSRYNPAREKGGTIGYLPTLSIPTLSIPTSSIPIWSTSHFVNSHFVNSHLVNVDKVGIDKVGIDEVGS